VRFLIIAFIVVSGCGRTAGPHRPLNSEAQPSAPVDQNISASGEEIFRRYACTSCHQIPSPVGAPPLQNLTAEYVERQLFSFREGTRKSDIMAPVARSMTEQEIKIIAQWLSVQRSSMTE
jgi:cytochrome c553